MKKKSNVKIYSGKLRIDEYGCLSILDDSGEGPYLIDLINTDFKVGEQIAVRYWITDKKISLSEAKHSYSHISLGGKITELNFELDAYSEYSILDYDETFNFGGHDMFKELSEKEKKYLILEIKKIAETQK